MNTVRTSTEIENIRMFQTIELKSKLDRLNSKLDEIEEQISELENKAMGLILTEQQNEKNN